MKQLITALIVLLLFILVSGQDKKEKGEKGKRDSTMTTIKKQIDSLDLKLSVILKKLEE